jgi:putative NADH-flavin reductase
MQSDSLRILVLGATGGVGRHVTEQALDAGHQVTVLVRDPARLQVSHPDLRIEVGDATSPAALRGVVRGQDAVISAIGAPARNASRVRERSARALVAAMEAEGVQRLVMLSSHGIYESEGELSWVMRWLVIPFYLKNAFADHERQEAVVKEHDGLAWTLVRPPHLTDGEPGPVEHGLGPAASMSISRASVARFLVEQVASEQYVRAIPVVAAA